MSRSDSPFWRQLALWPNIVSLLRVVMIFTAISLLLAGHARAAIILGLIAGLSDYLDGYLARKLDQSSRLGALLDLCCDQMFSIACFFIATVSGVWPYYLMIAWLLREALVAALRMSATQMGFFLPSSMLGKVSTNVLFYGFFFMGVDVADFSATIQPYMHWWALIVGHGGVALTWVAAISYVRAYIRGYDQHERAALAPSGGKPSGPGE